MLATLYTGDIGGFCIRVVWILNVSHILENINLSIGSGQELWPRAAHDSVLELPAVVSSSVEFLSV